MERTDDASGRQVHKGFSTIFRGRVLRGLRVRRATTSTARRRGRPGPDESTTAASASSSSAPSTLAAAAADDERTPPLGRPRFWRARRPLPVTSSKRFVSSRQTATAGPGQRHRERTERAGSRCGDSNATAGCGQAASSAHSGERSLAPAAGSGGNWNRSPGQPAGYERRSTADAPGRTVRARLPERRRDQPGASFTPGRPRRRRERSGSRLERRQAPRPLPLVVAVVAEQGRHDAVAIEQPPSVPGVLAEDEPASASPQDTQRDVLEVPIGVAGRGSTSASRGSSSASSPAPIRPAFDIELLDIRKLR